MISTIPLQCDCDSAIQSIGGYGNNVSKRKMTQRPEEICALFTCFTTLRNIL